MRTQNVWYFCTPCAGVSFLIAVTCIKAHSLTREDDGEQKSKGKEWARERREGKTPRGSGEKERERDVEMGGEGKKVEA